MRAEDVPEGLPRGTNPRSARIDRGIYKDVKLSLLNENGSANTFHLKNKGITVLAEDVKLLKGGLFEVQIQSDQGVVDGGHTYDVALSSKGEIFFWRARRED